MMDDKSAVSFAAYESQGARLERANKRAFILNVILLIVLLATNSAWIYYESTFTDEVKIDQEVDTGDGDANVIGIGDLRYGEDKANGK